MPADCPPLHPRPHYSLRIPPSEVVYPRLLSSVAFQQQKFAKIAAIPDDYERAREISLTNLQMTLISEQQERFSVGKTSPRLRLAIRAGCIEEEYLRFFEAGLPTSVRNSKDYQQFRAMLREPSLRERESVEEKVSRLVEELGVVLAQENLCIL
jgi:hypothetical protein